MYRIANPKKPGSEPIEESNTPAGRLRGRLPQAIVEIRWSRLTTETRDDLLAFLPAALASSHPGLRANQAVVLQVLAELGGRSTAGELRRRLIERGMTDRTRRWQTIQSLLAAGRLEVVGIESPLKPAPPEKASR